MAAVIPLSIICLIIVALIIFAVYSLIYKSKINKKLQNNESTAHVSMASNASFGKTILTIGAIVVSVSVISMLSELSSDIYNVQNNLNNNLNNKINSLMYEISALKNQLQEQASEFTMFESQLGKVDNVNHTVEAIFRCIPKTSGSDTSISVTIGKNTVTLEKANDGIYSGKMDLPLFEYINEVYASITTNGTTTSSSVYLDFYSLPYDDCLPSLWVDLEDEEFGFKNNKFYIKGIYWSEHQEITDGENYSEAKIGIKDEKLIFKINGKIEKEISITKKFNEISEELSLKSGDKAEIISQGTDCYGYIHQRVLLGAEKNDSGYEDWYEEGSESIFDSNGKLLYSKDGIYNEITG